MDDHVRKDGYVARKKNNKLVIGYRNAIIANLAERALNKGSCFFFYLATRTSSIMKGCEKHEKVYHGSVSDRSDDAVHWMYGKKGSQAIDIIRPERNSSH